MHRALTTALVCALLAGPAAGRERTVCFGSWTEAAPVVRKEALVAVEQLSALARASLGTVELVKTTLCREDGRYVYRLLVRESRGHLRTVSVDARKPFQP